MKDDALIFIAKRISIERKRLGMSQDFLTESIGIRQKTQSAIENGKNSPSLNYLYQLSQLGFDVQYIITGVKSKNLNEINQQSQLSQSKQKVAISLLETAIVLLESHDEN